MKKRRANIDKEYILKIFAGFAMNVKNMLAVRWTLFLLLLCHHFDFNILVYLQFWSRHVLWPLSVVLLVFNKVILSQGSAVVFDSTADDVYPPHNSAFWRISSRWRRSERWRCVIVLHKTNPTLWFRTTDEERSSRFQHSDWLLQHVEEKLYSWTLICILETHTNNPKTNAKFMTGALY